MSWLGDLLKCGIESNGRDLTVLAGHITVKGRAQTPDSTEVTVLLRDDNGDVLLCSGTTAPGAEDGFAKGCLFIKTDAGSGVKGVYENIGTSSSASFNLMGDITAGEISLTDGDILVGNGSNVAAAVTMSGDATLDNTGALTVAAGAIDEAMLSSYSADGLHAYRIARGTFDFAVDGGGTGAHGLGATIPDNSIVTRSWYEVLTTFQSPTTDAATIALGIPTDDAAGILAAVDINDGGNPFDAGLHEGIQDGAAANFTTKTTAARELTLTIGVEDITAGAMVVFCEYVVSD